MHSLQGKPAARRRVEREGKQGVARPVQAHADDDSRLGPRDEIREFRRWRIRGPAPSDENDRPFGPTDDVQTDITEHIALPSRESP